MGDLSTRLRTLQSRVATLFAACGAGLFVLLLLRNRDLFTRAIYEAGDPASNSMLTIEAKHFELLTGHYSRVGFHHPGPAYFYIQAVGEWLFHDVLHIVPAAYNGQVIAIMALNAALLAGALTVLYSWLRSATAVLAAAGVMLIFLAEHSQLVCSTWIPHACFAPFLLLLFAGASVAAGRLRHLWIMVLAGSLLVHGHAEFLVLVPVLALAVLIPQRRNLLSHRREVLIATGVLALFLTPIVLNEILHWPGEIAKYITYGHRAPNPPLDAARFVVQFWGTKPLPGTAFMIALFAGTFLLVRALPKAQARDYGRRLWWVTVAGTGLFGFYSWYGVDQLHASYIGTFSFALPLALLMLGSSALVVLISAQRQVWLRRLPVVAAASALVVGLWMASTSPALHRDHDDLAGVPAALTYLNAHAHGRPILLETRTDESWADALALALAISRDGKRACLTQDRWRLRTTPEFMCNSQDLARGARFTLSRVLPVPPGSPIVLNLNPIPASYPPSAVIARD
ncbi:hypothetical protein BST27_19870 [Mycobacterium intermedium]|uniref:Glycosyltransferase RgtA/B/C/D-like domain-containing protein n=1 Tax=Mycobacterium intermedium TaxID=28445 RepID=A0A1E3S745_MYCIE|nr:hypothetical protein [Mycobacterium intermedium]MCV6965284.1 hypothetical protein [Mycobacterium intermedium]ODQ97956.1 hypothetical protein BHQ20_24295 [Mycobacterium intermedium]OPE48188.1 hypothetical protein BV508_19050 [Mycobacterium intermedium]ORA99139.1 hypothetical protein BST27_19870 [Mycobacterium intermedium]